MSLIWPLHNSIRIHSFLFGLWKSDACPQHESQPSDVLVEKYAYVHTILYQAGGLHVQSHCPYLSVNYIHAAHSNYAKLTVKWETSTVPQISCVFNRTRCSNKTFTCVVVPLKLWFSEKYANLSTTHVTISELEVDFHLFSSMSASWLSL